MSEQAEAATETKDETNDNGTPADELTLDEQRFLMLTLWEALIVPKWTKDTLIDFGKAIFSKKLLKDLSDKEFKQIFPFLRDATVELGKKIAAEARRQKDANGEKKEDGGATAAEEKK